MSDKRYLVFYTGRTKPGVDIETVKSNLVLSMGIAEGKAHTLLNGGRKLLKRYATSVEAQVLADKLELAGVICDVCDGVKGVSNTAVEAGSESSLVRVLKNISATDEGESHPSLISRLIRPGLRRKHA
jgi:hypothetical protein